MQLGAYLKENKLSLRAFGRMIGTGHGRTVHRYLKGEQRPSDTMMRRIFDATGGQVTANDFFALPPGD